MITIQITGVDNSLTSSLFANWSSLGEAGLTFNFPGSDARFSKTYHIGSFSTGSGTPTLPGNTDLGRGAGEVLRDPIYANQPVAFEGEFRQGLNMAILANQKNVFERYTSSQIDSLTAAIAQGKKAVDDYKANPDSMFKAAIEFKDLGIQGDLSLNKIQRALSAWARANGIKAGQGFQIVDAPEIMMQEGVPANTESYVLYDGTVAFHQGMFKAGSYSRFGN